MNKLSFVDELVKLGAMRCMYKHAGDINTMDVPAGMMDNGSAPEALLTHPDKAATRLPRTAKLPSSLEPEGMLGTVAETRDPIDREKYNRAYRDRR